MNKSPFYTLGNQFLPRNLHDVIKWIRFITAQSPVTTEVLRKLATFPITSFTYSSDDPATRKKYEEVVKSVSLRTQLHNIGFQYFTIGNVFLSLHMPMQRSLKCPSCSSVYYAHTAEFIEFKRYEFVGKCPKCDSQQKFIRIDSKSMNIDEMNIIVWDPTNITVNHNPISGKSKYYYEIPNEIRRQVELGNMLYLESLPWEMIEAIRHKKNFEFAPGMIYHMKNVDTGFAANGICVPPLVSHFSLVYYQATLRKANESVAADYMAPLRVVFPQAQTGNSDPVVTMSLRNFASRMEEAFISHRRDSNHVLIAPVPIGYQAISGEGKTLLVSQEIREAEESLLLSMGVSRELISGTTNWTSSTVGLRMLKNTLDSYVEQVKEFLEWIGSRVEDHLGISPCEIGLTPFQLTDDEAVKNIFLNLLQTGGVSLTTMYEAMGRSYDEEQERILQDKKSAAVFEIRARVEIEQAKFLEAQRLSRTDEKMSDYKEVLQKATEVVQQLQAMDPNSAMMAMNILKSQDLPLYVMVDHLMQEAQNQPMMGTPPQVDENGNPVPGTEGNNAEGLPNGEAPLSPEAPGAPSAGNQQGVPQPNPDQTKSAAPKATKPAQKSNPSATKSK